MDAKLFITMLADKRIYDLKKMQYKYSVQDVAEMLALFKSTVYRTLPLRDSSGERLVYLENLATISLNAVKFLVREPSGLALLNHREAEDEIHSTLAIENIESSRDSIRRILQGYAPASESEERIYGIKKGLEFIADPDRKITEENLRKLYRIAVEDSLDVKNQLLPDNLYRHEPVFLVGVSVGHQGLSAEKLPAYMTELIAFINNGDDLDDLLKAGMIHFYIGYIHPYFDGNGRMARLLHLWFLVRRGYPAALYAAFSSYIQESRNRYYEAYALTERNREISGVIDVTPFLTYFVENVYNKLEAGKLESGTLQAFQKLLDDGKVTEKEHDLWNFVLAFYGTGEFSTKQLERDFGNAAYATIRSFVLKFAGFGLLSGQKYMNRVKYRVI